MPNTEQQLSEIRRILAVFSVDARTSAANGRTDRAKELERIVGRVLNVVLDANLADQNRNGPTFPAIDLGDPEARIAVQVTIRSDREKVKDALNDFLKNHMEETFDRLIVMMFVDKVNFRGAITADEKYADRKFAFRSRDDVWDLALLESKIERLDEDQIDRICTYLTEQAVVYCQPAVKTPVHRLPGVPAPSASFVPGSRDKELAELKERLSPDAPIFLWGVGGIGKTEVAIQLARNFAPPEGAYFLHYYDMPGEGEALRETILRANFTDYTYNKPDNDHRDQEYKERTDILRTEYPGALLVIDNFDCTGKTIAELMAEPAYIDLTAMGIRLVFTTRSRVKNGYEIKPLEETYLLTLMRENLDGMEVSDDELRQLIEAVDGHTLMVVLMVRTLAESWGDVTPETMLEALRNSDLNRTDFPEVVSDQNQSYEQRQIYAHMRALFDLSRLKENEAECAVLRCATLLPEDGMGDKLFKSCLPQEQHQPLRNLVNRGLLRHEGDLMTIHPVIREVCRTELEPTDENCGDFLERIWNRYDLEREYDARAFLQIAKCFSVAAEKLDDAEIVWHHHAGRFWTIVGRFQIAYRYRLRVVEFLEQDASADRLALAVACREFGSTCSHMGERKKAFDYQRRALNLLGKIQPPPYEELAQAHYSMGFAYSDNGDHRHALEHKRRAVFIREKYLSQNRLRLARAYNNLGSTYGKLEDHSKALHYKEMALKIRQEELPAHHPDLAVSYSNVGITYIHVRKYDKALEYHMKALEIREASLLDTHLHKALSYYHIGDIYERKKEYSLALQFFRDQLEILERVMQEGHPAIKKTRNRIGKLLRKMEKQETDSAALSPN